MLPCYGFISYKNVFSCYKKVSWSYGEHLYLPSWQLRAVCQPYFPIQTHRYLRPLLGYTSTYRGGTTRCRRAGLCRPGSSPLGHPACRLSLAKRSSGGKVTGGIITAGECGVFTGETNGSIQPLKMAPRSFL